MIVKLDNSTVYVCFKCGFINFASNKDSLFCCNCGGNLPLEDR